MGSRAIALGVIVTALAGCTTAGPQTAEKQAFSDDVAYLHRHTDVVILMDQSGQGRVAVLPKMQGRVMTSTAAGPNGYSFGWINRELVVAVPSSRSLGGGGPLWLGRGRAILHLPERRRLDRSTVDPGADTGAGVGAKSARAACCKTMAQELPGTVFDCAEREVRPEGTGCFNATAADVKMVAYESNNKVVNLGQAPWKKETGLLSIWILGMFNPSPEITIVVPFVAGPEDRLGPIVNDTYFGKVPANRLVVKDGVLFFGGDGKYRSKIGLTPQRAKTMLGSYDAVNGVLTIVQYNKPEGVVDYVNSMWQIQDRPYRGDVVNSYNDGPTSPGGKPLGPFYELETSSPAAALAPGASILHTHRTYHFAGSEAQLDPIAQATLGVTIAQIKAALKH
jgi:hypothetical protein